MPQYDYRCQDCREKFTVERSMSDTTAPSCSVCGSQNASRIWRAFILSGGIRQDVGQGVQPGSSSRSGCSSCSSHSCGSCCH